MKTPALSRPPVLALLATLVLLPVSLAHAQFSTTLVAKGATWKYPPNYNSLDGTAWKTALNFDATWASGPAPIGYGDPVTTTLPTPPIPRPITVYLRHTFSVSGTDRARIQGLFLGVRRDDGAVIYLNGVEIGRFNMPEGVAITNTTLASAAVGGTDEVNYFDGIVGPTVTGPALVAGTNILAVEVHQQSRDSSDTQFDLEVIGTEVQTDYGIITPGRGINFEDAEVTGFGSQSFTRNTALGHTDYSWESTGAGFLDYSAVIQASGSEFFYSSYEWAVYGGNSNFTTEHIDTRNYKDVKVVFGIRSMTTSGAFEAGDSIKVGAMTSNDGVAFPNEVVAANFTGGGTNTGQVTMISSTATKKARIPTNQTENTANPNWRQVAFNDSSWLSGTNGVGYERSPNDPINYTALVGINVAAMHSVNQTCYVRIPFTAPNPSTLQGLQLLLKYDDGFVAYLNGTEVARALAPGAAGTPPVFDAGASANHPDGDSSVFQEFNLTPFKNLLVEGANNVLAIHGLNFGVTSSDFLILPELRGTTLGGGEPTFPPANLNDLRIPFTGADENFQGPFFFYEAAIPDAVESLILFMQARMNESSEYLFADQIRVTGTPLTADSFENWILLESNLDLGEDEGKPGGNPDGDPLPNLVEYAVGGSAESPSLVSAVSGLPLEPQVEIVQDGPLKFVEMEFRMLNLTVSGTLNQPIGGYTVRDVKYIPQIAEDGLEPNDWNDGANGNTVAILAPGSDFVDNGDGTLNVRVRFTTPISPGTEQLFVRLLVQQIAR